MGASISGSISSKFAPILDLQFADARRTGKRFEYGQRGLGWKADLKMFARLIEMDEQQSDELFQIWDSPRTGKVDAREVVAVVLLCCSSTLNEKLGALFNFFDTDSDQLMSSSELAIMLNCAIRGMDKICMQGSTSDTAVHSKIATSIVKQFDPSGKRKINFANFFSWVIKSPSAISLCCRRGTTDSSGFVHKFFSGDDIDTLHFDWTKEFSGILQPASTLRHHGSMQKQSSTSSLTATIKSKHSNTVSGSETNDHEPKKMSSKYTHSDVMKIKSVFERIDVDHSGSISIKELTNSFEGTLSASASAMFAILDVDGSGTLEFNEILRAVFPLATEAEFVQMMSWAYPADIPDEDIATLASVFESLDDRLLNCVRFRDFLDRAIVEYNQPNQMDSSKDFIRLNLHSNTKRSKDELDTEMTFRSVISEVFVGHLGVSKLKQLHARLPDFPAMTGAQHNLLGAIFQKHMILEFGEDFTDEDITGEIGLSRAGMAKALGEMGLRPEDIEFVFVRMDSDNSNVVTLLEFKQSYRKIWAASNLLKGAPATMDDLDQD